MTLLLLWTLVFNPASDPDGLRHRVMRDIEVAGWSLHLRLDRDVLLSRAERRLLAKVEARRPQSGSRQARLRLEVVGPGEERLQTATLQMPCNDEGTLCRLRWDLEAAELPSARYRLSLTWLEGPRLGLQIAFRVQ